MNKIQAAKTIIKLAKYLATDQECIKTAGAKYTLTDETERYNGHILHRVKYADGTIGGWIESEKNLQGNAKVLDYAKIYEDAVVKGNAVVKGDSRVQGHALVSDNAIIEDSHVSDHASVLKQAKITDNSLVTGQAIVTDQAIVSKSIVIEKAKVFGKARIENHSSIVKTSQVSGMINHSFIYKSIVKGKVKDCELDSRIVEQNESLDKEDDFLKKQKK